MLGVYVDKQIGDRTEHGKLDLHAVDRGARAARGEDFAPEHDSVDLGIDTGVGKDGAYGICECLIDRELGLDNRLVVAVAGITVLGPLALKERQRTHYDGLAGAGLAGDDIERGAGPELYVANKGEVGYLKAENHFSCPFLILMSCCSSVGYMGCSRLYTFVRSSAGALE